MSCTDIDECALGTDNCDPVNATCTNTPGSFTCTCASGSSDVNGDGTLCVYPVSCQAIRTANPTAISGTYVIDVDGSGPNPPFTVYCEMTVDGGGWTLLGKVAGGNNSEGWRWDSAAWKTATTFGDACVLNTTAGCDGKSLAYGVLSLNQLYIDTGYGAAYYNLVTGNRTLLSYYASGFNFSALNLGTIIANRYGGSVDVNLQVVSMGDGDGESIGAGSADRCMLHVRTSTSPTSQTGFCAGRVRNGNTNSFVFAPTWVDNNNRADYARMNNGPSPTLAGTMFIFGR